MIVTTFSSHISRLKTISELGNRLNREVVFVGRSLSKYVLAANNVKMAPFLNNISLVSYRRQREKMLKKINANKSDYLVVCTGHQGEPGSALDRISRDQFSLKLSKEDKIIFSSKTIPTPINELSKDQLATKAPVSTGSASF
jgi:ribonuclease J